MGPEDKANIQFQRDLEELKSDILQASKQGTEMSVSVMKLQMLVTAFEQLQDHYADFKEEEEKRTAKSALVIELIWDLLRKL